MTRGLIIWGPAVLWAAVLFLLSSAERLGGPLPFTQADKLAHALVYAVLGGALAWCRHASRTRVAPWLFVLAGFLYGVSDEWHQSFVPGRQVSAGDWAADALGVVIGYVALSAWLAGRRVAPGDPPRVPTPTS